VDPEIPITKVFPEVFTVPAVRVNVPLTVPVLLPLNKDVAVVKVTPLALLLLIVRFVKLAVGDAERF
jgi:hypothetical protein